MNYREREEGVCGGVEREDIRVLGMGGCSVVEAQTEAFQKTNSESPPSVPLQCTKMTYFFLQKRCSRLWLLFFECFVSVCHLWMFLRERDVDYVVLWEDWMGYVCLL